MASRVTSLDPNSRIPIRECQAQNNVQSKQTVAPIKNDLGGSEHDKPHQERVAATHIQLTYIFKGCMPFVALVFICMAALYLIPGIVWWLPNRIYQ